MENFRVKKNQMSQKKETKASKQVVLFIKQKFSAIFPIKTFEFSISIGTKFTEGNSCDNLSAAAK